MYKTIYLFLLLPAVVCAQYDYPVSEIPKELLVNAQVVVRVDETTVTIHSDDDAVLEETFVATILKAEGKDAGLCLGEESRFSKVKLMKGRILDSSGKVVVTTKDEDIKEFGGTAEYEFTGSKIKYLQLEYPSYPYTVEFKKKTLMKGFTGIPSGIIQKLGISVETWRYRIVAPSAYKFKWKGQNTDIQPKTSIDGRNTIFEWEAKQLLAQPDEPSNPFFGNIYAQLLFAPETINFDGHQGDFKTWNSIGQFFYDLNNGRETLSSATVAKVQELTAGKTNREKIEILYRITQDNCRYVSIQLGIGGWQTFEAQFVEQKKYGDCKALSNYTQALLKSAGIESWEASIFAGTDGAPECDEAFPDPHFNHMILYVPSEDCWLECTSKHFPAGYLGAFTANRQALLFTPHGGELKKTPSLQVSDNFEDAFTQINIREDGSAQLNHRAHFGGERHEYYRHFAFETTHEELEKSFAQHADFSVSKLNNIAVRADRQSPVAELDYEVETLKYGTLSGKRMFVPLTKSSPVKRNLPANEKRVLNLKMDDAYVLRDTFSLQFPQGYEAENIPTGKKLESEFGTYEMQIEKLANGVVVRRRVEIYPLEVPASRYSEVRQFLLDSAKADAAQLVLVKKQ